MTPPKKLRPALPFSIEDLWAGRTNEAVSSKLDAAKQALEKQERDELEARRQVQEE